MTEATTGRLHDDELGVLRDLADEGEPVLVSSRQLLALLDEVAEHRALPVEWGIRESGESWLIGRDRDEAATILESLLRRRGRECELVTRTGPGPWIPVTDEQGGQG